MDQDRCKICRGGPLKVFAHTAECPRCGVLLYYPYPRDDHRLVADGTGKKWSRDDTFAWYAASSCFNHDNFTAMVNFAMGTACRKQKIDVLDYGGGGGQFALVCRSLFPTAAVYITDISDESLLETWQPLNIQIPFAAFADDGTRFDWIFLNDVFEHVSDPLGLLKQLAGKLKPGGKIFIDSPKQFWLYPLARVISKKLYAKLLRGTVSPMHLQIWTRRAFQIAIREGGLAIDRYRETGEYTMPADYYLRNMGVTHPLLRAAGRLFYAGGRRVARNKIFCVLSAAG